MKPPGPYLSVVPEPGDEDPELEAYLGAARQLAEPDAQSRARVARALNAALPPTAPLPAFGANAASSSSSASLSAAARLHAPWLAVGAIVIGGLGFWIGSSVGRSEPVASPSAAAPAVTQSAPPSVATTTPPESVAVLSPSQAAHGIADASPAPAPEAAPAVRVAATKSAPRRKAPLAAQAHRAPSRAAVGGATSGATAGSLDFREALERLRRARTQLEQGHAAASLLLLSELDRDAGELLFEEREATRVLALCATGETPAARATAERLASRSPRSIYLRRLATSCIDESAAVPDAAPIERGAGSPAH